MLQGFGELEHHGPLRESNKVATSEPNLREFTKIPAKEVRSESNIPSRVSPSKENISQGEKIYCYSKFKVFYDILQHDLRSHQVTLKYGVLIKIKNVKFLRKGLQMENLDYVLSNHDILNNKLFCGIE